MKISTRGSDIMSGFASKLIERWKRKAAMSREGLIDSVAEWLKVESLSKSPGMDEVAIRLNMEPTYYERRYVEHVLDMVNRLGYELVLKDYPVTNKDQSEQ